MIFLLLSITSEGQSLRVVDIWHLKKGDFNKDSLRSFFAKGQLYLKYNEIVQIEFVDSAKTQRNYEFRIKHAENYEQWREIGSKPVLQLPNLGGGKYNLEIADTLRPDKVLLKLSFEYEQAFWDKAWFWPALITYFLFLVGIGIYFFSLYNLRQKLKMQDVRNRIAADLHDEVGSNLNSIAIFVELLRKNAPTSLLPILDKITNNSTESIQLMQDTIWAIQTKNDDFHLFIDKMRGVAVGVLAAKGISLTFENNIENTKVNIAMDVRKNAYLIFKEAINNIVKHSDASKAEVSIAATSDQVEIMIKDNGKGFDTAKIHEGNGLKNFKDRAQDNEMLVKIDSVVNFGTTIHLVIPMY